MMRFVLICLVAGAFAYPNSGHDNPYYTSWDNGQYPPSRASTEDSANACMPGHGGTTGFACTHMAMLSDDMMLAAEKDGHANHFVYAVAGGQPSQCGECYQVKVDANGYKQLIVQVFTHAGHKDSDVRPGQFDIFMAAGGMGKYTAVNRDCRHANCGTACIEGLFETDKATWNYNEFNGNYEDCYAGGMRLNNPDDLKLGKHCDGLSAFDGSQLKNRILSDSCWRTHKDGWRRNFERTSFTRVQCPKGLYSITGLSLNDDEKYPAPYLGLTLDVSCKTNVNTYEKACITTMHDGCVPACAWPKNVPKARTRPGYRVISRCNKQGDVMLQSYARQAINYFSSNQTHAEL